MPILMSLFEESLVFDLNECPNPSAGLRQCDVCYRGRNEIRFGRCETDPPRVRGWSSAGMPGPVLVLPHLPGIGPSM